MAPGIHPPIKAIKALSPDNRFWRVNWYGGITGSESIAKDRLVKVLISPFKENADPFADPFSIDSIDHPHKRLVETSIGNLPCIHIGSIWQYGQYQDPSRFKIKPTFLENISFTGSMEFVRSDHRLPDGGFLIGRKDWRIDNAEALASQCLLFRNERKDEFIIPVMEIIRFYYATSTRVIQHLMSDEYYRTEGNCMYDLARSSSDFSSGKAVIHLRQQFSDDDAWTAARLAFSKYAHTQANKIFYSMALQRKKTCQILHPITLPPLQQTSLLQYGKPINSSDGQKRYLILWINTCTGDFPFRGDLGVSRDNSGEENNPPGEKTSDRPPRTPKPKTTSEFVNQNDEPPDPHTEMTILRLPERFSYLSGNRLIKVNEDHGEHRAKPEPPHINKEETKGSFSTSPPTSGGASAPAGFSASGPQKEIIYCYNRIELIFAGLDCLAARGLINSWRMINVEGCVQKVRRIDDSTTILANIFPAKDKQGEKLSSSFTCRHAHSKRGILVIEIIFLGRTCYLLEILRKGNESYAAVLISRKDYTALDNEVLLDIIIECAKNEGRFLHTIKVPSVKCLKITHYWGNSIEAFVKGMPKLINKLIS